MSAVLVVVGSLKGSGVTTFAVALAAVWPANPPAGRAPGRVAAPPSRAASARPVEQAAGPVGRAAVRPPGRPVARPAPVVVEADCAGGDLGGWYWVPDSPGVASLAAACRTGRVDLDEHVTRLPFGVDAVVGPAAGGPAGVAVGVLAEAGRALWSAGRPAVVVDVGRLEAAAASAPLVAEADVVLVVSRGDEASLMRLADAGLPGTARVVLAGGSRYPAGEIGRLTGLCVAGAVPWDGGAAQVVCGRRPARAGWTRRGLPAAARAVAASLATAAVGGAAGGG